MSNFVSYENMQSLFTGVGNKLDEKVMKFMETHFEYRHKFINETREDFLNITAMNVGNLFFRTEAVKQNIIDKNYYNSLKNPALH